jgi:16S rRNA (adenine1518-N6/adenine1519-N6)-dimethyltransferase
MKSVRPKKKLGQHFLTDLSIAEKIAQTLTFDHYEKVLEIGPGMGVLTQFLPWKEGKVSLIELDSESIEYLQANYVNMIDKIHLSTLMGKAPFAIIGNFPYNISTQIVFKTLENRDQIPFFSGMFQKEVAQRICEPPGTKKYGILSVLTQLFYEAKYEFTVPPGVFNPPPKVDSGVLTLKRKAIYTLDCNEKLLIKIVKMSFQQRRKTLRNSLKTLGLPKNITEDSIFDLRPEKLSGDDFIALTKKIDHGQLPT